jgi:hypothetical protein
MRALILAIVFLAVSLAPLEADACDDPSGVCVDDDKAKWSSDASLSKKSRRKQWKKNRKRKPVPVTVNIDGGRGSAFVDGRYLAPGESRELKPGKHDVHVRDGDRVLAQGVLTVPRRSDGVTVTVVHPDGGGGSVPPPPPG